MSKILLTNRPLYALVDDCDYERVSRFRWCAASSNSTPYVKATVKDHNNKIIFLHRFVMMARQGDEIDHINGNPLDNRTENLRFCTHAENMANRHSHAEVLQMVRRLEVPDCDLEIKTWKRRPDRDTFTDDGERVLAYQEKTGHVFHFPPGMEP